MDNGKHLVDGKTVPFTYNPAEMFGKVKRYLPLADGQVLDLTTINREGMEMEFHDRQRYYMWATAEMFVPTKRPQTVK